MSLSDRQFGPHCEWVKNATWIMIAEGTTGTEIGTVKEKILSCAMKTTDSDSWECTTTCGMIEDHKFVRLR